MVEHIEKVIYINLEERIDRNEEIKNELLSVFPEDKILRFNAIKLNGYGIGCSSSHIEALKIAIENNWKNCLIVEDDAKFNNFKNGNNILNALITNPYDVIILGGVIDYGSGAPEKETFRVKNCQTTTAYLVSNHYYKTLLNNFEEGCNKLKQGMCIQIHTIDQYWKRLQEKDNFFMIYPVLMYQRPSYSDIQKYHADYTSFFTLK